MFRQPGPRSGMMLVPQSAPQADTIRSSVRNSSGPRLCEQ